MSKTAIISERFDRTISGRHGTSHIIWTLGAIAQRIGVGTDFVRDTLATRPGSPVKEIGGRYYAFEDDLMAYMRSGGA